MDSQTIHCENLNIFTIETENRIIHIAISTDEITKIQLKYIKETYGKILQIFNGSVGNNGNKIIYLK